MTSELNKLLWPYQKSWISQAGPARNYFVMFSAPDQELENYPIHHAIDDGLTTLKANEALKKICTNICSYQEFSISKHPEGSPPFPTDSNRFLPLSNNEGAEGTETKVDDKGDNSFTDVRSPEGGETQLGSMKGWNTVRSEAPKKSDKEYCWFGFNCNELRRHQSCDYGHTLQHRNALSSNPPRPYLKTKICNDPKCSKGKNCKFAHSEPDLQCTFCGESGHIRKGCPDSRLTS